MKRVLLPIAVACFLVATWLTSDGGTSVPDLIGIGGSAILLGIAWLVILVVRVGRTRSIRSTLTVSAMVVALLIAGGYTVSWFEAGFPLRFAASRSSLERYALSISGTDKHSDQTRQVGLYQVRETEALENGVVRLITAECMFDDCGLVYIPEGAPPVVGEDYYIQIDQSWYRWERSW